MDRLIPWERLERRIEPFYPKAGRGADRQLRQDHHAAERLTLTVAEPTICLQGK